MGWTPQSEEINLELHKAKEALDDLAVKLRNRSLQNMGGWTHEHREECLALSAEISELILKISTLEG